MARAGADRTPWTHAPWTRAPWTRAPWTRAPWTVWGPALAVLGGLLGAAVLGTLARTGGLFVYLLDDPYIHLALARQIAAGHYGINPGEAAAPSSSVLWPFLLAPTARTAAGLLTPLAVNAVCAALSVGVLHRLLARSAAAVGTGPQAGTRRVLLLLLVPTLNLVALTLFGMEHALHVLLTLVVVDGLVAAAGGAPVPRAVWVAAALGPLVRYEALAVTLPALALLAALGHRRAALATLVATVVPLAAFSAFLVGLGLDPLPSSVLVKSDLVGTGVLDVTGQLQTAIQHPRGTLLMAAGLALAAEALAPARPRAERGLAAVGATTVALHALGSHYNHRYEVYVVAVVVPLLLHLYRRPLFQGARERPWAHAALGALAVGCLAAPYVRLSVVAPTVAGQIYEQQVQMARFVREVHRGPVAINDLGYVAYHGGGHYVLDLWGLASQEARRARRADPSGAWMDRLARAHGVEAALVYTDWFDGLPAGWARVGTLRLSTPNVLLGGSAVDVYATRPAACARLVGDLRRFRPTLPPGVGLDIEPGACAEASRAAPAVSAPGALGVPPAFGARLDAAGLRYRVLDREGDGYALVRVPLASGTALLQWADLRHVAVVQTLGAVRDAAAGPGLYHPAARSPAVALVPTGSVVEAARARGALAVVNGAFFETPGQPSTQIAFPLATRGRVATGGSSPYGPGRPGAGAARWGRPLRALGLADTTVHVAPYDHATGVPLGEPAFAESVVSYAPGGHPTRIATRFHVLGALDADGDGATETLLVATSSGETTIDAPVDLLTRLGVAAADQTTLDGGASVLVWNRRTGTLERPARGQPLPHYLTFRRR